MQYDAETPEDYIQQLPQERVEPIQKLRDIFNTHLPDGFVETISWGMIGWVVPLSTYPKGYHTKPEQPLPFINLASQKRHIAIYHSGLYSNSDLLKWFQESWPKHATTKLNMGKCCVRFTNPKTIPFELMKQLAAKMTPEQWVKTYEATLLGE